ncbi:MAG TPA: hypothetical protein VKO18_01795 [Terriglobia bacterium]|nr:hypothetical protein [Terriglobia bacterium]
MRRPAEVCYVCSDARLVAETLRRLEASLKANPPPIPTVTFYQFA